MDCATDFTVADLKSDEVSLIYWTTFSRKQFIRKIVINLIVKLE